MFGEPKKKTLAKPTFWSRQVMYFDLGEIRDQSGLVSVAASIKSPSLQYFSGDGMLFKGWKTSLILSIQPAFFGAFFRGSLNPKLLLHIKRGEVVTSIFPMMENVGRWLSSNLDAGWDVLPPAIRVLKYLNLEIVPSTFNLV